MNTYVKCIFKYLCSFNIIMTFWYTSTFWPRYSIKEATITCISTSYTSYHEISNGSFIGYTLYNHSFLCFIFQAEAEDLESWLAIRRVVTCLWKPHSASASIYDQFFYIIVILDILFKILSYFFIFVLS